MFIVSNKLIKNGKILNIEWFVYIFRFNVKNPYHLVLLGSDPRDRFVNK